MILNTQGMVVKQQGVVLAFSEQSALSGEQLGSAAVTLPVRAQPGLYVRLGAIEVRQLTDAQRVTVEQRAVAWWAQWAATGDPAAHMALSAEPDAVPSSADDASKSAKFADLTDETEGIADDPGSEE